MKKCILAVFVLAVAAIAQVDRGVELYEAKNYQQAEKVLREAVGSEPENARAHYYLGMTLLNLKRPAEAAESLKTAADLAPTSDQYRMALVRAYIDQKDYDQAETALNQVREINAENAELPYYSGLINLQKKNYEQAASDFETAIERNPDNAYAHYYAGMAYNGLKRPDQMTSHFQMFLKLAPKAPEAAKVRSFLNVR